MKYYFLLGALSPHGVDIVLMFKQTIIDNSYKDNLLRKYSSTTKFILKNVIGLTVFPLILYK